MNLSDEEVGLVVKYNELRKAFVAAKKNRAKDEDAYRKASTELAEFRSYWRGIREAVALPEDGTAAPKTVKSKAGGKKTAAASK